MNSPQQRDHNLLAAFVCLDTNRNGLLERSELEEFKAMLQSASGVKVRSLCAIDFAVDGRIK
jgi:hypothetical protein